MKISDPVVYVCNRRVPKECLFQMHLDSHFENAMLGYTCNFHKDRTRDTPPTPHPTPIIHFHHRHHAFLRASVDMRDATTYTCINRK